MVTMIALAVLMVLVVGAIRFTGTNRVAAVSKLKADRMAACAETARRYVLSRLRIFGAAPTELKLDSAGVVNYTTIPDDPVASKQTRIGPSHFGEDITTTTSAIGIVQPGTIGASGKTVFDVANTLRDSGGLGGTYYRVVMKCQEPGALGVGRESEIEFVFRYGL